MIKSLHPRIPLNGTVGESDNDDTCPECGEILEYLPLEDGREYYYCNNCNYSRGDK